MQAAAAASNGPLDWTPQDKCYFCVDGKLLTVNEHGDLVPEGPGVAAAAAAGGSSTTPAVAMRQHERDLADSRVSVVIGIRCIELGEIRVRGIDNVALHSGRLGEQLLGDSDSDSSDSSEIVAMRNSLANASVTSMLQKTLQRQQHQQQQMSSFESMAAQFATIASMNGFSQMHTGKCFCYGSVNYRYFEYSNWNQWQSIHIPTPNHSQASSTISSYKCTRTRPR